MPKIYRPLIIRKDEATESAADLLILTMHTMIMLFGQKIEQQK